MIFCPKYRRKVFYPPLDTRLKELILEKQEPYGYRVLGMEVMPDHVHLLLDVNPQIGIAKIVGQIKGYTARALREEFPWLKKRLPSVWTITPDIKECNQNLSHQVPFPHRTHRLALNRFPSICLQIASHDGKLQNNISHQSCC